MKTCFARLASVALLIIVVPQSSVALTMLASDFDKICGQAGWVLLAKVVHEELLPAMDADSAPSMCYTLQPLAQWDGRLALTAPRICYLGDLLSNNKRIVAGLRYPVVGETSVFFIKTPNSSDVVSPLVGWNQGHFQVKASEGGGDTVFTAGGTAVCGFDANRRSYSLDGDAADGLVLDGPARACIPMPLAVFEKKVRQCTR